MFLISLLFVIPFGLLSGFLGGMSGDDFPGFPFGGVFFFIVPFIYGLVGFVITAFSRVVYNLIAKWTGGIELEFETEEE